MKFSDVFEFRNKSGIKAGEGLEQGRYPFYTSSDELTKHLNEFLFDGNALVFGTGGNASVHFADQKFAVSTDCLVAQPIDHKKVHAKFYYYFLRGNMRILERGFKGAGLKHISKSYISDIELPNVDFDRQKMVVAILDQADALRQKRKQSLQLLDDFLRATFFDMFGLLDEKDDYILLSKLTEKISVGHVGPTSFAYVEKNGGIPFLRTQNVKRNLIDLNDLAYVVRDFHNKLKKSQIHGGDVLISRVGVNRGMAAVVPHDLGEANCANVVIVGKSDKFNSIFLAAYLNHTYGKSAKFGYSVGSAQGVVNTGIVRKWPIIDVPLALQNKFASIVCQVEETKQKMRSSWVELDNQFNALTQRYFG